MQIEIPDIANQGITGYIRYSYDNSVNIIPAILQVILAIVIVMVFFALLMYSFNLLYPRSKRYRELLSDMYVVGMIRKLANEDKIELDKEMDNFMKLDKKLRYHTKEVHQDQLS